MKDLKIRVTSGVVGVILLLLVLYLSYRLNNPIILDAAVTVFSIIGVRELFKAFENKGLKPMIGFGQLVIALAFIIRNDLELKYLNNLLGLDYLTIVLLFLSLIVMYSLLTLLKQERRAEDIGVTLVGIFYLGFLFSHLGKISDMRYVGLVFIIAFGTDTFAYFGGNFFGKNKLCPSLSPNKTVEGAVSGILGSVFLTIAYCLVLKIMDIYRFIPLAIIASIFSQCGDLVASSIKRDCKIKDYGKLIPGHGGVLDRFDSVIFTSPIIYYYVELFINK